MPRLALVAGGTGGHLYPAIEVGRVYRQRFGQEPLFLTRSGGDADKIKAAGFQPTPFLDASPPKSKKDYPGFALALMKGAQTARRLISEDKSTHLLGFGNYISMAAMISAPAGVVLGAHEANGVVGKANRWLLPKLKGLYVSFETSLETIPERHKSKVQVTGFPVRPQEVSDRRVAKQELGLPLDMPILMVMGGSLGATKLNQVVVESLNSLDGWFTYWISGERDAKWAKESLAAMPPSVQARVRLVDYEHGMPKVWAAADLAVTRAGAGTLFEAWHFGTPSLLVPFPFATHDHQTANAQEWERRFGFPVVPDKDFTVEVLLFHLKTLGRHLEEVRHRLLATPPPDAADLILDLFLES